MDARHKVFWIQTPQWPSNECINGYLRQYNDILFYFLHDMIKGLRACVNRKSNPKAVRLFAWARVHNKPQQVGLNHNYNMTFSMITRQIRGI